MWTGNLEHRVGGASISLVLVELKLVLAIHRTVPPRVQIILVSHVSGSILSWLYKYHVQGHSAPVHFLSRVDGLPASSVIVQLLLTRLQTSSVWSGAVKPRPISFRTEASTASCCNGTVQLYARDSILLERQRARHWAGPSSEQLCFWRLIRIGEEASCQIISQLYRHW